MKTKLTKILATVPNTCDADFIRALFEAGMNGVRLNTAHQSIEESLTVVRLVRSVSPTIAVLLDTKGPEVRTKGIDPPITLTKGDEVLILPPGGTVTESGGSSPSKEKKWFSTSYPGFTVEIGPGSSILIDDGLVELTVLAREGGNLVCRAVNDGVIKKNKSVNTPGNHLRLPSLQDRDREFIQFAMEEDIDFIAHSFVRGKDDLLAIQDMLDARSSSVKLIAKIENQEGVEHLDEILAHAAGVLVARGDLGVDVPLEYLPGIQ